MEDQVIDESVENEVIEQGNESEDKGNKIPEKFKQDLYRYKSESQKLKEKIAALESEREERQSEALKQKEDYKSLYEQTSDKYNSLKEALVTEKKSSAIKQVARDMGLSESFAEIVAKAEGLDHLTVETTSTGKVNILGADLFLENAMEKYKDILPAKKAAPNVDNSRAGSYKQGKTSYTARDLLKLQNSAKDEDKQLYKEIMSTKRHLIKQG